jgi:hypothetical protein
LRKKREREREGRADWRERERNYLKIKDIIKYFFA